MPHEVTAHRDDGRVRGTVALVALAAMLLGAVGALVSARGIEPALANDLLPRWDLAAHLVNGWCDYFFLTTFQWRRLLWDLWSQGYWPPGQSLFQLPFYLAFGGTLSAGLHSSVAAFVLAGVLGVAVLVEAWGRAAWLPVAVAVAFMVTSPFYLAYASVAMSEMVGALAQAGVLLCYVRAVRSGSVRDARWFALSLTALFFTKYNYFLLLAVPLASHEWLEQTAGQTTSRRLAGAWRALRAGLASPDGALVALYLAALAAVELTDGFEFSLAGQRIALRTIGYSAHPVLYLLLARVWWRHRTGRIDWAALRALDPRVGPLLTWFVVPVTIWLASPFPNHIKDVANLLFNIPMGEPTVRLGLAAYLQSVRDEYFLHGGLLFAALAGFGVAVWQFRALPPTVRLLVLTAVLQFVMVTVHQTRDPRFLLLAMPPFWLASGSGLGAWIAGRAPRLAVAAGVVTLAAGLYGARPAVDGATFRRLAFHNYVHSPALAAAFAAVRDTTSPGEQTAVIGRHEAVSPGLVRWQLGPASGESALPIEVLRVADEPRLDEADVVLHVESREALTPAFHAEATRDAARVEARVARGALVAVQTIVVDSPGVTLRVYRATSRAATRRGRS